MQPIHQCGVCESTSLEEIWALPLLPLTERFGPYTPEKRLAYNQSLRMCQTCGHFQLGAQLDPSILYTPQAYSFRTSASASAIRGTEVFFHFLKSVLQGRKVNSFVDVGGNDLYLAKMLAPIAPVRAVVDPICSPIDNQTVEGIRVFGRMIENVNLKKETVAPNLVACRHTLEHLGKPLRFLQQLFEQTADDCLFIFEIPCFENLMEAQRFDAVFHQHYHYFDLAAFQQLLRQAGGTYIAHHHNRQGSCGGALLVAFKKGARADCVPLDLKKRAGDCVARLGWYGKQMEAMGALLDAMPRPLFGYGASLMLATLAYHLRRSLEQLDCVLDDDPAKDGFTYENVPVRVRHTEKNPPPSNACYIITSLENVRPIFGRLTAFQPRRILVPLLA